MRGTFFALLFFGVWWLSGCENNSMGYAQLDLQAETVTLSDNGKVLIAGDSEMLTIVDLSDPSQMVMKGGISPTFDRVSTIKISPDAQKVYAGYGHDGVFEIDISDKDLPKTNRILFGEKHENGRKESISLNGANDIAFSKDRTKLYVVNWGEGFVVYDISDLDHVHKISSLALDDKVVSTRRVILSQDETKVYIAAGMAGMIVIDVSKPVHPKVISQYKTISFLHDIAISEDERTAYLGCNEKGIYVLDIGDIHSPKVLGTYKADFAYKLKLLDRSRRLYVADGVSGIRIFDTKDRTKLIPQKSFELQEGIVYDLAIGKDGKYLYAALGNTLKLYEIPGS